MDKQQFIRNFCVISHVDHGKSTLADRFLEITGTVSKDKLHEQFLDQNPISRKRGITIKLAPVRMNYTLSANSYTLNLIDTPGHVDFSYEVSRTLAACEGAVLLVDATQGIQAQTVAHYQAAKKEGLVIIPVINKIDLQNARIDVLKKDLMTSFSFREDETILVSARTGQNVDLLLKEIIKRIPCPKGSQNNILRSLIFDAQYDEHRGVVAYIKVVDGEIAVGDRVRFYQSEVETQVTDVGYFSPQLVSSQKLSAGGIGYLITGIKDIKKVRVGDTITSSKFNPSTSLRARIQSSKLDEELRPLPGYKIPKPMVFFGVYPKNSKDFVNLKESLAKLTLNDTSLSYAAEYSSYLGSGFRVGFLGLLHAEIVKERLKQEFSLDLLFTSPQVLYQKLKTGEIQEPYMKLIIYTPLDFVGSIMSLCQKRKGTLLNVFYHPRSAVIEYEMPYSMFIRGLAGEIKSISSGFASIDYEITTYKRADLVNLEIRINGMPIDVLSELVYKDEAVHKALGKVEKLKNSLSRQQFRQIIQAVAEGRIVAREEIPPFRKDVLAKMSGGDRTRKDKLLEKQKKGKSKLLVTSKINISQEALFSLFKEV